MANSRFTTSNLRPSQRGTTMSVLETLASHTCVSTTYIRAMAPNPDNFKHVGRHEEYYLNGGDLFLLVDNTFFCVHSYFLARDSTKFRDELNARPEPGKKRKGSHESNAIQIHGATPDEFAKFLWVFYNRTYDQYRATVDEWTSILKIACAHDFPGVKDFAVRGLESCDIPIANRIRLYRTFEVDAHYIIPWFVRLCLREDGPTDGETEIMGTKVSLIIYRARERLRSMVSPAEPPLAISESAAVEVISSILGYNSPIAGPATPPGPNIPSDKKKGKPNNEAFGTYAPACRTPEAIDFFEGTDERYIRSWEQRLRLVDGINIATQLETHQSSLTFAYKYVANGNIRVAFFIVTPTRFVLVFLAHFWTLTASQSLRYSFHDPYLWHLIAIANRTSCACSMSFSCCFCTYFSDLLPSL